LKEATAIFAHGLQARPVSGNVCTDLIHCATISVTSSTILTQWIRRGWSHWTQQHRRCIWPGYCTQPISHWTFQHQKHSHVQTTRLSGAIL